MRKFLNICLFFLILIFFGSTFNYYSSNKIIEIKDYNRSNIDEIINNKVSNLPILESDTNNVIEFNSGYNQNDDENNKRFWNLFKK